MNICNTQNSGETAKLTSVLSEEVSFRKHEGTCIEDL